MFDIVAVLTDKHTEMRQLDEGSFLNADCDKKEATFTYVFQKKDSTITYEYRKSAPSVITFERLEIDGKKVFSYDFKSKEKDFANMDMLFADNLNFDYFENNFAVLRYIAYNTVQPDDSYVKFIMHFVSHMLWFRSLQENGYIGLMTGVEALDPWIAKNNLNKEFQSFLKKLANIESEIDIVSQNDNNSFIVEKHKNARFLFSGVASSGTRALELLFFWSKRFDEVSFLFLDEFDAFYHYDLAINVLKYIVDLDNVQAVFTTHNSYLASNDIMRPDCYYILKKGKLASFVDSTEREIREGHNLEKLLRNGEFDG